jgi:hypothetical protein
VAFVVFAIVILLGSQRRSAHRCDAHQGAKGYRPQENGWGTAVGRARQPASPDLICEIPTLVARDGCGLPRDASRCSPKTTARASAEPAVGVGVGTRYHSAMSFEWPALGPAHPVAGFVEPMDWGTSRYTVIRVPEALVAAAQELGTRRVGGELEGTPVNLALTRAPVFSGTFVWAGASLLRRMRLEAGDPVTGHLAPVDPDHVPVPPDLADALAVAGVSDAWEALSPASRRRELVPIDAAVSAATRGRRIQTLLGRLVQ